MHSSFKSAARPMAVISRPIAALKFNPSNPRLHSRRQIRQIARSINAFGFNVPILVDSDLKISAGHGRVLAAQELGLNDVPTVCLDHLTEAQARAFTIADNRLSEISTWDDKVLAEQLKDLSVPNLDFNLEVTGFEMGEIDFRIESAALADKDDDANAIPPRPLGPPVCQPGDLWLLDQHRLYCGSALDSGVFSLLMEGERAAMIFTDPPYNVPINGHASGLGAVRHREFAMASGEMDSRQFAEFLAQSLALLAQNSLDGSIHFVCMDWAHSSEILVAGHKSYSKLKNICVWVKHNAGMGSQYRSQHEFIFVFKNGRTPHRNNIELGRFGRHRSNVWNYPGINSFGRVGEEGNLLALHPTVKPVALVADAILDCSARGDLVLDAFLGSGTTIIAAERTGRRCYGLEIDPLYTDTIIRRWQAYTGGAAKHALTGKRFDETALSSESPHD
jgi:DNA modification methylase